MRRRTGMVLLPEARLPAALLGRDLGEDWIVARDRVAFLVITEVVDGAVLSAWTADGRLAGERFAASAAAFQGLLDAVVAAGACQPPLEIPSAEASALAFLQTRARPGSHA